MLITYSCGGLLKEASSSNEDLEIASIGNKVTLKALRQIVLEKATISFEHDFHKNDLYFLNGYQSWTDTKEFRFDEELRDVRKIPKFMDNIWKFSCYGDSFIVNYEKGKTHGFDVAYIKGQDPLFIGSKNYKNAYLIIELLKKKNTINLISDIKNKALGKGEEFVIFDYEMTEDVEGGMSSYYGSMKPKSERKLFGYTSWYNHYENINEEVIMSALSKADPRFELFQIDDGFEEHVGDWLRIDQEKFPHGLTPIIDKIKEKGLLSGIWLAPFVAETDSDIFQNHKDFIAKYDNGEYVCSGGNWSKFYALDLDNEEAVDYIRKCLRFYKELGFDFFKLDFLYGASKKPMKGKTHAETAEFAYNLIDEEIGDRLVLGCGAIVSNAIEKFDYLRVGPDLTLNFDDAFYMKHMHRERISTKVTLQNTIYRSPMNGHAFLNDPDVFLLRDDNIKLNEKQKEAVLLINSLFGSLLMTSDNPLDYDEKKKNLLNEGLYRFQNAKVLSYRTLKDKIEVKYLLDNEEKSFIYDTKKGVLTNG